MIDGATVPRLKPHVRLEFNKARAAWVLQAPERVFLPDDVALAILTRCDGFLTIAAIAASLAREYDGPIDAIEGDVRELLQGLVDKGMIADARD